MPPKKPFSEAAGAIHPDKQDNVGVAPILKEEKGINNIFELFNNLYKEIKTLNIEQLQSTKQSLKMGLNTLRTGKGYDNSVLTSTVEQQFQRHLHVLHVLFNASEVDINNQKTNLTHYLKSISKPEDRYAKPTIIPKVLKGLAEKMAGLDVLLEEKIKEANEITQNLDPNPAEEKLHAELHEARIKHHELESTTRTDIENEKDQNFYQLQIQLLEEQESRLRQSIEKSLKDEEFKFHAFHASAPLKIFNTEGTNTEPPPDLSALTNEILNRIPELLASYEQTLQSKQTLFSELQQTVHAQTSSEFSEKIQNLHNERDTLLKQYQETFQQMENQFQENKNNFTLLKKLSETYAKTDKTKTATIKELTETIINLRNQLTNADEQYKNLLSRAQTIEVTILNKIDQYKKELLSSHEVENRLHIEKEQSDELFDLYHKFSTQKDSIVSDEIKKDHEELIKAKTSAEATLREADSLIQNLNLRIEKQEEKIKEMIATSQSKTELTEARKRLNLHTTRIKEDKTRESLKKDQSNEFSLIQQLFDTSKNAIISKADQSATIAKLNAQLKKLETELDRRFSPEELEEKVRLLFKEIDEDNQRYQHEIDSIKTQAHERISSLETALSASKENSTQLTSLLEQAKTDMKEAVLQCLTHLSRVADLEKAYNDEAKKLSASKENNQALDHKNQMLLKSIKIEKERHDQARHELHDAKKSLAHVNSLLVNETETVSALEIELAQARGAVDASILKTKTLEEEHKKKEEALENQVAMLQAKINDLEAKNKFLSSALLQAINNAEEGGRNAIERDAAQGYLALLSAQFSWLKQGLKTASNTQSDSPIVLTFGSNDAAPKPAPGNTTSATENLSNKSFNFDEMMKDLIAHPEQLRKVNSDLHFKKSVLMTDPQEIKKEFFTHNDAQHHIKMFYVDEQSVDENPVEIKVVVNQFKKDDDVTFRPEKVHLTPNAHLAKQIEAAILLADKTGMPFIKVSEKMSIENRQLVYKTLNDLIHSESRVLKNITQDKLMFLESGLPMNEDGEAVKSAPAVGRR